MALYASIEQLRAVAFQATTTALADANATAILERASRLFDRLAEVNDDYFAASAGGAATARTFYGDGTTFLDIDEYDTTTAPVVTMPSGYTVPAYVIINNSLVRTFANNGSRVNSDHGWFNDAAQWFFGDTTYGWPEGVPVTVTAKWGTASAVSADIVQAVLWLAIYIFRSDPAYMKAVDIDRANTDALYAQAKAVAETYHQREAAFAFG